VNIAAVRRRLGSSPSPIPGHRKEIIEVPESGELVSHHADFFGSFVESIQKLLSCGIRGRTLVEPLEIGGRYARM